MTLRHVARAHALLLLAFAVALLVVPMPVLGALGLAAPDFATLALARVAAGVAVVLAAACWGLGAIPPGPALVRTALGLALAHGLLTALLGIQQVAIWSNRAGAVLVAASALLLVAYALAAVRIRRPIEAIPEALRSPTVRVEG